MSSQSRFSAKSIFAPTRKNALTAAGIIASLYGVLIVNNLILNANIDRLRTNKSDPNEVTDVGSHESPPTLTLWALGFLPFVTSFYVCYYLLRKDGAPLLAASPSPLVAKLCEVRTRVGIVVASLFVSLYVVLRLLSAFALVCYYPMDEMRTLCSFSTSIMDAVNAKHGPDSAWLAQGTLIGALRGDVKKNKMVLNDHDFDICYDKKLEPVILDVVKSLGYTYERFSRTYSDLDTHIRLYPPTFSLLAGHSGPLLTELQACEPPATGTYKLEGCNGLAQTIPNDFEKRLVAEYGQTWLVPRNDNHNLICKLFEGY